MRIVNVFRRRNKLTFVISGPVPGKTERIFASIEDAKKAKRAVINLIIAGGKGKGIDYDLALKFAEHFGSRKIEKLKK